MPQSLQTLFIPLPCTESALEPCDGDNFCSQGLQKAFVLCKSPTFFGKLRCIPAEASEKGTSRTQTGFLPSSVYVTWSSVRKRAPKSSVTGMIYSLYLGLCLGFDDGCWGENVWQGSDLSRVFVRDACGVSEVLLPCKIEQNKYSCYCCAAHIAELLAQRASLWMHNVILTSTCNPSGV